ncbi:hypothetical protein GC174_15120 [bacterium]|nr:hypothetical protein [bacterium]
MIRPVNINELNHWLAAATILLMPCIAIALITSNTPTSSVASQLPLVLIYAVLGKYVLFGMLNLVYLMPWRFIYSGKR